MIRRIALLLTTLLALVLIASPASANTADQALATRYTLPLATGNIWQAQVPASPALDPNSATYGPAFANSIGVTQDATGTWKVTGVPGLRWRSAFNIYVADTATPRYSACSRETAAGAGWSWMDRLHEATVPSGYSAGIPMPTGSYVYDGGADHSMAIYAPAWDGGKGRYWEFYKGLDNGVLQGSLDATTDTFNASNLFRFNNIPVKLFRYSGSTQVYLYGTDTQPLYVKNVTTTGFQLSSTPGGPAFDVPTSLSSVVAYAYDRQGRPCYKLYDGGGRMTSVATNPLGVFQNLTSPIEDVNWGRHATGAMPVIAGLITADEWDAVANGTAQDFGHVVSYLVPAAKCGVRHWPAVRNDCNGGGKVGVLPEGSWFHLPISTDCTRWDARISTATQPLLGYYRRVKAMCVNAVKYGFRVKDQTGSGSSYATDGKPTQADGGTAGGGQHWPNDYVDPWAADLAHLEVLANGGQQYFG